MARFLIIICILIIMPVPFHAKEWNLASPSGKIILSFSGSGNNDFGYTVTLNGKIVINKSAIGLTFGGYTYPCSLRAQNLRTSGKDDFVLCSGKRLHVSENYNQMELKFKEKGYIFSIISKAYDNGIAFCYRISSQSGKMIEITEEKTEFSLPKDSYTWIHPYWNERKKPCYETYSTNHVKVNNLQLPDRGWGFPVLAESTDKSIWTFLTEATLDGTYPATHLDNSGHDKSFKVRFPEMDEAVIPDAHANPVSAMPLQTPWRVIAVAETLDGIFQNQIAQCLNPESKVQDTSWIKPGKATWSWWYDGQSTRSFGKQKAYVDFCARMGWPYSLVDAGWQKMDGKGIEGLAEYSREKGIGLWLWYHSGAGRTQKDSPETRLMSDDSLRRNEMARIHALGIKGIKVDFFDTDKQDVVKLYAKILKDAADFNLMVDLHGASLPRGLERTYPNLMTTEAIRGAETLGMPERCEKAARHNATVIFTRNVVGSMDYTPVTFSDKIRQGKVAKRETSLAHQIALSVAFESGFHCFADRYEAYESLDDIQKKYLQDVPTAWDESRILSGYPSDHAVVARRKGSEWWIGAINGINQERVLSFDLPEDFLNKNVILISDGQDIDHWEAKELKITDLHQEIRVTNNGGFAIRMK